MLNGQTLMMEIDLKFRFYLDTLLLRFVSVFFTFFSGFIKILTKVIQATFQSKGVFKTLKTNYPGRINLFNDDKMTCIHRRSL